MAGKHAKLAPSAGRRWVACPGSVRLIESLPRDDRDRPNVDSMWGTACHMALADCLMPGDITPASLPGKTYVVDEPTVPEAERTFILTQEDAANINTAYAYVMARLTEYGRDATMLVEERVNCGANFRMLDPFTQKEVPAPLDICWGTTDVASDSPGYLEVIDYKNGRGYVEVVDNIQLLLYALGVMAAIEREYPPQRVRLTIIGPRMLKDGQPVEAVRTWEFQAAEMADHAVRLGTAAWETTQPDAPLRPGDHCRATFCPAQGVCPALSGAAVTALQGRVALGTVGELTAGPGGLDDRARSQSLPTNPDGSMGTPPVLRPVDAGAYTLPAQGPKLSTSAGQPDLDADLVQALTLTPDQMTVEQRCRVLDAREMIRSWVTAVEKFALTEMLRGTAYPGFKLVQGRRSKSWALDGDKLMEQFSRFHRIGDDGKAAGKLPKAQYTTTSVLSPAQAEKRIKPMVTERTWKKIKDLIKVEPGKPTIAPESDTRAAVTVTSAESILGIEDQRKEVPDDDAWMK